MSDPEQTLAFRVGYDTHAGETGKNNEDAFGYTNISLQSGEMMHLAIMADGIGGQQAGERASQLAVQTIEESLNQNKNHHIARNLGRALAEANRRIHEEARASSEKRGMGTTATVAAILGNRLYIGHVGDSRAYLVRNGQIYQLTTDHTWAQEVIAAGRYTPEEVRQHPNRHVIKRYLGIKAEMNVDTFVCWEENGEQNPASLLLRPNDTLLLCTDGLSDLVNDELIKSTVLKYPAQKAAEQLVKMARARGGYDNITVIVMQGQSVEIPRQLPFSMRNMALIGVGVVTLGLAGILGLKVLAGGGPPPSATPAIPQTGMATATVRTMVQATAPSAQTPGVSVPRATLPPTTTPLKTATPAPVPTAPAASTLPTRPATANPTEVSAPRYAAPLLREPEDGAPFSVNDRITFRWSWNSTLEPDEYFDVRIWQGDAPHYGKTNTNEREWQMSKGSLGPGTYSWAVAVIRKDANGNVTNDHLSPESAPRAFTISGGGGGGGGGSSGGSSGGATGP